MLRMLSGAIPSTWALALALADLGLDVELMYVYCVSGRVVRAS